MAELSAVLLVKNSTADPIKVHIYSSWQQLCLLAWESRIVAPHSSDYFSYKGQPFKFDIYQLNDKKLGSLLQAVTLMSEQSENYEVNGTADGGAGVTKTVLEPGSRSLLGAMQIVTTRRNVKELWDNVNCYQQLHLDAEEVWKMEDKEQSSLIKKQYHILIRQYHPDKMGGDETLAKDIILAHCVLSDPEKKQQYDRHLRSKSLLSRSFWAQLWNDMKRADNKWWMQFGFSAVSVVGGGVLIVVSGGSATPVVIIVGGIVGGAFAGGGYLTTKALFALENREHGLSAGEYAARYGAGALAGALAGAAGGVAQVGIVGVGANAAVGAGTYAGVGAIGGAAGGGSFAVAEHLCDADEVTLASVGYEFVTGAVGGAAAGAAGGAIGGHFAGKFADEFGGAAAAPLGRKVGAGLLKGMAGGAANAIVNEVKEGWESLADDREQEAPSFSAAAQKVSNIATAAGIGAGIGVAVETGLHAMASKEDIAMQQHKSQTRQEVLNEPSSAGYPPEVARIREMNRLSRAVNDANIQNRGVEGGIHIGEKPFYKGVTPALDALPGSTIPKPLPETSTFEVCSQISSSQVAVAAEQAVAMDELEMIWIGMHVTGATQFPGSVRDMYMFVCFTDSSGVRHKRIARGHSSGVRLPTTARDVAVTFSESTCGVVPSDENRVVKTFSDGLQERWGQTIPWSQLHMRYRRAHLPLAKWDRKETKWRERYHVFEYPNPQTRTFWLAGGFGFGYVWKVTDEMHQPVDDDGVVKITPWD